MLTVFVAAIMNIFHNKISFIKLNAEKDSKEKLEIKREVLMEKINQ